MSRRTPPLALVQRLRLYNHVIQLREQGLSYNQIIEQIRRLNGVRLHIFQVYRWTHGLHTPLGNVNTFFAKSSPTLAYIIGVKAGDGYIYKSDYNYMFELRVVDYEFAAETGRKLAKLLSRKKPYQPWWDRNNSRRWCVWCCSVLLHHFLQRPPVKLKAYVEHCKDCVAAFLRAFFDSEGSITGRTLIVYNTNKEVLLYVELLLRRYFSIETTGPHKAQKVGQSFRSPTNGKIYQTKKACYRLYIRVESLALFHRYIGFTIRRKQQRLTEAVQN